MFAVIGNSPSSGSTFLGDLLDSTPYSVCGPELGIFTDRRIYSDYSAYQAKPFKTNASSSVYATKNSLNRHRLFNYALDESTFRELLSKADEPKLFLEGFGRRFAAFRGKDNAVWFEKTPRNIEMAAPFLKAFPDRYFIHVLRNPIYVIDSLLRRGLPRGIATFTWLFQVANVYWLENQNRVLVIRYEDLVWDPWGETAKLMSLVANQNISQEEIIDGYMRNTYRRYSSKKNDAWTVSGYGVVDNANDRNVDEGILTLVKEAMDWRISNRWAEAYGVPPVTFREAVEKFGYKEDVERILRCSAKSERAKFFGTSDMVHLIKKGIIELKHCGRCPALGGIPVERAHPQ